MAMRLDTSDDSCVTLPYAVSDIQPLLWLIGRALAKSPSYCEAGLDMQSALRRHGFDGRAIETLDGVFRLAAEVRKMQRQFFETRERAWLPTIKAKEVELDNALRILLGNS